MSQLVRNRLIVGDVRQELAHLPSASIDCVITSPPYWGLRDYGMAGQIGLEPNVGAWVDELRGVLRDLARVVKPAGSVWLNLGQTYSRHIKSGAPAKSMLLGPERLLLALSSDGWLVRNTVIYAKANPMPHSVTDRLTNSYEVVYFLTRSPRYFFDLDAIRLPHRSTATGRRGRAYPPAHASAPHWRQATGGNQGLVSQKALGVVGHALGRNPGDVWVMATAKFRGEHFATFPTRLVERPLLATCPELVCDRCGKPYRRTSSVERREINRDRHQRRLDARVLHYSRRYDVIRRQGLLVPDCECESSASPGVVLDPFFGAGTVGVVAERYRRDWVGVELNPRFAELAERRLAQERATRAAGDGLSVNETTRSRSPHSHLTRGGRSHDQGSGGVREG